MHRHQVQFSGTKQRQGDRIGQCHQLVFVHDQQAVDAEYRLRGKDGMYRWMSVHAVPLRTKDGRIVRWLGINIDIDDRKQLELANHIGSFPA